jgi:hypothetical protein
VGPIAPKRCDSRHKIPLFSLASSAISALVLLLRSRPIAEGALSSRYSLAQCFGLCRFGLASAKGRKYRLV